MGLKFSPEMKPSYANTYQLPSASRSMETSRLDIQHHLMCMLEGGIYPANAEAAITSALSPRQTNDGRPAVLDVGSGSGVWLAAMAEKFPEADCVGVDFKPHKPQIARGKLSVIEGDAMEVLNAYEGKFDVVHCRFLLIHVAEARQLLEKMVNCLRPGGVLMNFDEGEGRTVLENPPVECWSLRSLYDTIEFLTPDTFWGERTKDFLVNHASLELGAFNEYWINGNWVAADDLNGKEKREFIRSVSYFPMTADACMPALKKSGWTDEMEETCMREVPKEIETGYPRFSYRIVSAWGIKL